MRRRLHFRKRPCAPAVGVAGSCVGSSHPTPTPLSFHHRASSIDSPRPPATRAPRDSQVVEAEARSPGRIRRGHRLGIVRQRKAGKEKEILDKELPRGRDRRIPLREKQRGDARRDSDCLRDRLDNESRALAPAFVGQEVGQYILHSAVPRARAPIPRRDLTARLPGMSRSERSRYKRLRSWVPDRWRSGENRERGRDVRRGEILGKLEPHLGSRRHRPETPCRRRSSRDPCEERGAVCPPQPDPAPRLTRGRSGDE